MFRSSFMIILAILNIHLIQGYELPLPPEHNLRRQDRLEFMLKPLAFLPITHRETLPGQRRNDPNILFEFNRDRSGDYAFLWIPRSARGFDPTQRGTWIFIFSGRLNTLQEVKIFLGESPFTYLVLRPENHIFRGEAFLEGERIASRVPVLIDTERLMGASLRDIVTATQGHIDWNLFFLDDGEIGQLSKEFALSAQRILGPGFPEAIDGALDERGVWRRIESGQPFQPGGFNCSGFAKWFVDALAFGVARLYLPLNDRLLEKPLEIRGTTYTTSLEDARDPYFGLDWTRALIRELTMLSQPGAKPGWTDFDVTDYPWTRYVPNRGYPIEKLPAIAQWLAVTRPGRLFLLSVSGDFRPNPNAPILLQHRHVAVLLVWAENGVLQHALFETDGSGAKRTSIASLQSRYPNHYIHLVETPLVRRFRFQELNQRGDAR